MQKIFRKIIEELREKATKERDKCAEWVKKSIPENVVKYNHGEYCYLDSVHTVERLVKKADIGWIPCDERYPDTDEYILLSFENFSIPIIGRYEEDVEGGAFYAGDEEETLASHGLVVNAWRGLPEPYSEKETGDIEVKISNGDKIRCMSDEELAEAMLEIDEIEKYAPFCGSSEKCNEILDAGEKIQTEMCWECLLKWLRAECK